MEIVNNKELDKKNGYQKNQLITLGLTGVFRVQYIDEMDMGGTVTSCYVLVEEYSLEHHKIFLPVRLAPKKSRAIANEKEIRNIKAHLEKTKIVPLDYKVNSNKKMKTYEGLVLAGGFPKLVEAYFEIKEEMRTSDRVDKRYITFHERLYTNITNEIASSLDIEVAKARTFFDDIIQELSSH